jgi:Ser-tRNA(Ala) deacylase AlaX
MLSDTNNEIKSNKQYHPQMHSAEHILNQTMVRMFNCGRSFSNHIEKKKSKCDYHFNRNLTQQEIEEIEKRVNEVIEQNLVVSEEFYSRTEVKEKFNLSKLPDDAGDKVRIIKIGNYDACPCSGQHVSLTNEIGSFKIISTDYNDGVLRVRFKLV